jgi:hypothetical protein
MSWQGKGRQHKENEMGPMAIRKKEEKQALASDKGVSHDAHPIWEELWIGVAAVWRKDLEDSMGALGKTVNLLVWIVIVIAAPVAVHLLGWVLFTLSNAIS